ncbi:MAG: polysaccharide lyase family protein, partial [Acidobacteriaceae bacterium]
MKPSTKSMTRLLLASILFSLPVLCTLFANAQADSATPVFTIGVFNRSSVEFAQGAPNQPVNFTVGTSTAQKDWYAKQPVESVSTPSQPNAAKPIAPWAIHFSLPNSPASSYRLHVALLIENPGVPALRVAINGKTGTFYLQPKLDYNGGDYSDATFAAYSHADVVVDFPGSYLHSGANTITLQAVEKPPASLPDAALSPGDALTYDAIELDPSTKHISLSDSSAFVLPTIFYRQRQGQLQESVDAILRYARPLKPNSSIDLALDGKHYRQALLSSQDFGEEKVEFSVPEFPAHTEARLTWNIAGHARHAREFIDPQKKWT